jgi:hypothetical protein
VATTRVCKTWHKALHSNPTTQKVLFLKSAEIRDVLVPDNLSFSLVSVISMDRCRTIGSYHPMLMSICGSVRPDAQRSYPQGDTYCFPTSTRYPKGNWRSMFIMQPSCNSVTVVMCSVLGTEKNVFRFRNEAGVEMGELYDFNLVRGATATQQARGEIFTNFWINMEELDWCRGTWVRREVRNGVVRHPRWLVEGRRLPVLHPLTDDEEDEENSEDDEDEEVMDETTG